MPLINTVDKFETQFPFTVLQFENYALLPTVLSFEIGFVYAPPSPCCAPNWLDQRIAAIQAQIVALEDLSLQLTVNGGLITYTLDTGQSRQVVTKLDAIRAISGLDKLYNTLAMLCARKSGSNSFTARPGW